MCHPTARRRSAGTWSSGLATQTSRFIPFANRGFANLGYSVSGFQFAVLTELLLTITGKWRVIGRQGIPAASTFQRNGKWGVD
jgi:hypothetical protein